jgi:tetratricopeptide (TPR) repeat protein
MGGPKRKRGAILCVLLVVAAGSGVGLWQEMDDSGARTVAAYFAAAMTAPRYVHDGRTLEARANVIIADLAAETQQRENDIRSALERYANGDWLNRSRSGWDAVLTQMAAQHFESALTAARSLPKGWQKETFIGTMELGRGRLHEATTALKLAFDEANKAKVLDTPEALPLLTALGSLPLSRRSFVEAEPHLRRAAKIADRSPGIDRRDHAHILLHFAQTLAGQGFPEEAEPICQRAVELAAKHARTTGRPDADQAFLEENLRKIVREREAAR